MLTLAIDTVSTQGSLALIRDREIIASQTWAKASSHSETITAAFHELLSKNNLSSNQLTRLAVNVGPGSFTGIRVGVTFARTLSYSYQLPIFALNGLHLLASQPAVKSHSILRVAQYAFRNLIYTAEYSLDHGLVKETQSPRAVTITALELLIDRDILVVGTGYNSLLSHCSHDLRAKMIRDPSARDYSEAIDFLYTSAIDKSPPGLTDWIHTIPLYIRASEAEEKLNSGIIKSH
ncbi:MAG: tRNA (adenosine(37)-N6)-threonylcarbamoyltransferase complex dimerization subunit type 1 TsaB [Bdellovibrionales bacterium RBG_16_40_8]|nr:MAG: tRNA (adenosine(37)-N6)-threonylcarbamoyltransferase complex dimerization subunit type 1 TsaB [Bdellovibrionales bacterium RBG_16_40_8]